MCDRLATQDCPPIVALALNILTIIFEFQLQRFVPENIQSMQNALTPALQSTNTKVLSPLCTVLSKIFQNFPPPVPDVKPGQPPPAPVPLQPVHTFQNAVLDVLGAYLGSQGQERMSTPLVEVGLIILHSLSQVRPEVIDRFLGLMTTVTVQKLIRDYGASLQVQQQPNQPPPNTKDPNMLCSLLPANQKLAPNKMMKEVALVLLSAVQIVNTRFNSIPNRKAFVGPIVWLIEKSLEADMLQEVSGIVQGWVTNKTIQLTARDRADLVSKMMRFESLPTQSGAQLQTTLLELVLYLYNEEPTARLEPQTKFDSAVLLGLRSKDPKLRSAFFKILDDK